MKRPPIVVVMGHVDHGKTSLLDYIKKTNVAGKEAGGITQAVGAYEISHNNEQITFIDTPGHEAFVEMRARGTKAADIAILVVAGEEGVKPQTRDVIKIINDTKIPFVVAITKMDKPNSDLMRVQADLSKEGLFLEGYGGDVSFVGVSSKTGEGVKELLDHVLLQAELLDLKFDEKAPAEGVVLESKMDNQKGITATIVLQNGTLKVGDEAAAGTTTIKIRAIENFLGKRVKEAQPSSPVVLSGFNALPEAGEMFLVGGKPHSKKEELQNLLIKREVKENVINLVLKAADSGSLDALEALIKNIKLPENYHLEIIEKSVGDITDSNIKLAMTTNSVIIGFKVELSKIAESIVKNYLNDHKLRIFTSDIVYHLIEELQTWLDNFKKKIPIADLEVLAVFGKKGSGKVVLGGKVVMGQITNNATYGVTRDDKEIGTGKIINLQRNKQDVHRVEKDKECGMLFSTSVDLKEGDHLISYEDF